MNSPVNKVAHSRNGAIAGICFAVVIGMVGLSYAAVPLYNLFCKVTGYGGTTSVSESVTGVVLDRTMTVHFDANLARGMPWKFRPVQMSQSLKVGETGLAFFRAENPTNRTIIGTASYNVTPQKAGLYFAKLECFCFAEQELEPGESVEMPVSYFVDPAIAEDPNLDDVRTITLSYTFFETTPETSQSDGQRLSLKIR